MSKIVGSLGMDVGPTSSGVGTPCAIMFNVSENDIKFRASVINISFIATVLNYRVNLSSADTNTIITRID